MTSEGCEVPGPAPPAGATRVVVVGGGFGGVWTTIYLDRLSRRRPLEVTLISRNNYFLMTPFLFEAGSGVLDPRHAVNPIRRLFRRARFIEAEVTAVDLERRVVRARHRSEDAEFEVPYDQIVLALGGSTNRLVPGSEYAFPFKSLADAIVLRNRVIDLFERANIETDPLARERLLTFAVVGGGLVGVELMGELREFVRSLSRYYPPRCSEKMRFLLIEAGPVIMPEMDRSLAAYAVRTLERRGVTVMTGTPVQAIGDGWLDLPGGRREHPATVVLATGLSPHPLLATLDLPKDRKGRIAVDATMRAPSRPEVWALGDCASIPDPDGQPYPPLAQHALREARVLSRNVAAGLAGEPLRPFVYRSLGMLASLGGYAGAGRVLFLKLRGFPAWWVWRTYYLFQMPRLERKLRIVMDWTVALLFQYDAVKLDVSGEVHPATSPEGRAPARV